jgi:peroxiredoxin
VLLALPLAAQTAATPYVGAKAPEIALTSLDGKPLKLSALLAKGDVAVVFLRGYPGYQCPYCQKQVHAFVEDAPKFAARKVQVLLVYPGEATTTQATKDATAPPNTAPLGQRGTEFLAKEGTLPANIHFVLDPGFSAVNLYGLRWDAPHETAYPSTFLLDRKGVVLYRKISHSHGDRATTEEILAAEPATP